MRTNIVIDNIFSKFVAKSYIESTNIVKFSLNYLRNAGSIIVRNVKVKVLMEIYMIKEVDKWISSHKEVYVSYTGNANCFLLRLMGNLTINQKHLKSMSKTMFLRI
jgi:hypothetical protein